MIFTNEVARNLEDSLVLDERFGLYAKGFVAVAALVGPSVALVMRFDGERMTCEVAETVSDVDFRISALPEVWEKLASPTLVNVSLTRMLREGDISLDGDVNRAMKNWRPLFWVVARLREQLSGVFEF
jgi:ubiquinone biosynthesis protein UbiJ